MVVSCRVYQYKCVSGAPYYITIGDGGNAEGLATRWVNPQPAWSVFRQARCSSHLKLFRPLIGLTILFKSSYIIFYPSIYFCILLLFSRKSLSSTVFYFIPLIPTYFVSRCSYGHGELLVSNSTHALWQW